MKFAIVSDTHNNLPNQKKAVEWLKKENIKLILHCGDIGSPEFLKEALANFDGELLGVLGNMDVDWKIDLENYQQPPKMKQILSSANAAEIKIFEEMAEIGIEANPPSLPPSLKLRRIKKLRRARKIAVIHNPKSAKKLAESQKYDLVFYGHTHQPCLVRRSFSEGGGRKVKECRLINPGELAGQFYKPTFAVYDTKSDKLELKILEKLFE